MIQLNLIEKTALVLGGIWASLCFLTGWALKLSFTSTLLLVCLAEGLWLLYGYSLRWQLPTVPGPEPRLFSGHLPELLAEGSPALYRRLYKQYGPVFRVFMGRRVRIVVCDIEWVSKIGNSEFSTYDGRPTPSIRSRESYSLLSIRGPLWHKIRSALVPTFSSNQLKSIVPHLITATDRMNQNLSEVKPDQPLNMLDAWSGMTMDAIGLVAFGTDFDCQNLKNQNEQHSVVKNAKLIFKSTRLSESPVNQIMAAFPFLVPIGRFVGRSLMQRVLNMWESLDTTAFSVITKRKQDPNWNQVNDLLTRILEARDANHNPLSTEEVRDQVNTFLLAGYETTANTLTYASLLLAQNPACLKKLLEEIDTLTAAAGASGGGDEKSNGSDRAPEIEFDNLDDYHYLDAVIKETLRMYPVAMVSREPNADSKIMGHDIPKGTMVHCPPFVVHFDDKHYSEPERFIPERWLSSHPEQQKRNKNTVLGFGIGPRGCIGQRFAMEEAKLALIRILKRYTFQLHESTKLPIQCVLGITLTPKLPIWMTVHPRK